MHIEELVAREIAVLVVGAEGRHVCAVGAGSDYVSRLRLRARFVVEPDTLLLCLHLQPPLERPLATPQDERQWLLHSDC